MLGAVLAGGRSRRMGRTKALVEVEGIPMAVRVADALRAGGCGPVLIVGGDEHELGVLGLPVIADLHPGEGPLGGVLTALAVVAERAERADLAQRDERAVLVAACDLAWLSGVAVAALVDAAAVHPEADVIMADGDRPQPALAIWRLSAHDRLRTAFVGGERALHRAARTVRAVEVDVDPSVLGNVNTPADLAR